MTFTEEQTQVDTLLAKLEGHEEQLRNNWCVPRETGRFLRLMVITLGARRICEVGTSIGYSTLWLASGARQTGGQIDTLEYFEGRQQQARQHIQEAGLEDIVHFHTGQAIDLLKQFQSEGKTFELAFIDAAKAEYVEYARLLEPMLASGGLLIADNTQSHRPEMLDFLEAMEGSPLFDVAELETPNGQLVARKR